MEKLNNQYFLSAVQAAFGADVLAHEEAFGMLNIELSPARIHEAIQWLQQHRDLSVNYLTNIAGVHYPEAVGREIWASITSPTLLVCITQKQ